MFQAVEKPGLIRSLRAACQWSGGRSLFWQVVGTIFAWLYIVGLHLHNNGLWYQGDAPRHAANGLFWWDFLTSLPVNPLEFALGYYARYPVINPTAYPPLFYVLEGALFWLFGASPFIAKYLVLAFAFTAALYATAWLRRWLCEEAGWGGVLLLLQPGIIGWSHAIMLNVPSMAMVLAALYHTRRWLETPASRHIYPAASFAVLGILTYLHASIVIWIILAWVVAQGHRWVLRDRRALTLGVLSLVVLLPWALVVLRWAPVHAAWVFNPNMVSNPYRWTFYLMRLPELFTAPALILAVLGVGVGICQRRWRQEVTLSVIWALVSYAGLSYIVAREGRYILFLGPPIVFLAFVAMMPLIRGGWVRWRPLPSLLFLSGTAILLGLHVWTASLVRVPRVDGFEEVVAFFERASPKERIFYYGHYNGVFSFYVRAGDKDFDRGVVLASKLLYVTKIMFNQFDRVSSASEVVEILRKECGCTLLAIETSGVSDRIPAAKHLREALRGKEFQLVKSFSIVDPRATRIDVYRLLLPLERPEQLELRFPALGKGRMFRVKPLEP